MRSGLEKYISFLFLSTVDLCSWLVVLCSLFGCYVLCCSYATQIVLKKKKNVLLQNPSLVLSFCAFANTMYYTRELSPTRGRESPVGFAHTHTRQVKILDALL